MVLHAGCAIPAKLSRAPAGVSVIMRYTLRLLTLDQLARAAGLVCALEARAREERRALRRVALRDRVSGWARLRRQTSSDTRVTGDQTPVAHQGTKQFKADPKGKPSPIPLENCPWCGERFGGQKIIHSLAGR